MEVVLVEFIEAWGNKDDGYIVNEQTATRKDLIVKDLNDESLLQALIDDGFLEEGVTLEDVRFDDWVAGAIEITRVSDDRPLGCLEYEGN